MTEKVRTEGSNNMHEKFHRRIYDCVLKSSTVLKMTGCFLVISEASVLMCLKNDFYRKLLGKMLPLMVKLYH